MKKLVFIALVAFSTASFASSGKVVSKVRAKAPTACCTVGEFTNCGEGDQCCVSRSQYCHAHTCSKATLATL